MGGFIANAGKNGEKAFNETNNFGTYFGFADQALKVSEAARLAPFGFNAAEAASVTRTLPGSTALGHAGGAVSALGLVDNIYDMSQNGLNATNGLSAASNALNVGSWGAATFGAAGGAASTVAAPLMAAGAAGISLGMASNDWIADKGILGKDEATGKGRSWSDMAADWGTAADDAVGGGALGTAAGIAATLGGSIVGTAGTILTAPLVIGEGIVDGIGALLSW